MKRVILISLFTALSCLTSLYGQAIIQLNPDSTAFPSPQQAIYNFGDTIQYRFFIKNIGTDTLVEQVAVNQLVNGANLLVDSLPLTFLAPGDSFYAGLSDSIGSNRYGGGINVVVIWPSAANTIVSGDSSETEVIVEGVSSLVDSEMSPYKWNIYPNPSSSMLHVETNLEAYKVLKTTIYALDGRAMQEIEGLPVQIDLGDLPEGMYWLRIGLKDGREEYFRLVKKRD